VLRPCLGPQARGLLAPWQASKWGGFLNAARGQTEGGTRRL